MVYNVNNGNAINIGYPVIGDVGSACAQARVTTTNASWTFFVDATDGTNWTDRSTASALNRPGWDTPTNLKLHRDSDSQVTLRWTDNASQETGYVVYNYTTQVGTTTDNSLAVQVNLNQTYSFSVRPYVKNPAVPCRINGQDDLIYGGHSASLTYRHGQGKKIVVTRYGHTGNFLGDATLPGADQYAKANSFCQNDEAVGLLFGGSTWKAMLAGQPGDMFAANTVYVNRLGDVIFYTTSAITALPLPINNSNAVLLPESCPSTNQCPASYHPWTGYNNYTGGWRGAAETCGVPLGTDATRWTTTANVGSMGDSLSTGGSWIDYQRPLCTQSRGLYCIEQ